MVKKIVWSPLAIESYESIISYLLHKFGEIAVRKFIESVDERIQLIATRPRMFRPSNKKKNTYLSSIHNKVILIYRYKPRTKQIELVVFWGMQNPKNKPL